MHGSIAMKDDLIRPARTPSQQAAPVLLKVQESARALREVSLMLKHRRAGRLDLFGDAPAHNYNCNR